LKLRYWIAGIVTAGIGLVLVRVISPHVTQSMVKLAVYFAGVTLALAGLVIIVLGISRRSR
jgi:hypothetical protein